MITYIDTSVLLKLLVDDEPAGDAAERLWMESAFVVCAEIGYAEARAARAAVHRNVVTVSANLVRSAGDLAESDMLRGYGAVHLAASLAAGAAVFAAADDRLLAAAQRNGLATSNPLTPPR